MERQPDIAPANPVESLRLAMRQLCLAAEEVARHNAALLDAQVVLDPEGKPVDPVLHLVEAKLRIEDFIFGVLKKRDEQVLATGIFQC